MSQKIDIRERRYNGVDYDTLHPETNINMVLDSSNNSVGDVNGALYGDGNGNIVGATISNPNLLDNPWFTVNQRGFTSGDFTDGKYTVDRWFTTYGSTPNGNVVLNSDNTITFTGTNVGNSYLFQPGTPVTVGKTYTISVKMGDDSVLSAHGQLYDTTSDIGVGINNSGSKISLSYQTQTYGWSFVVTIAANDTFTIRALKLEVGSVSTLANDIVPNYDLELQKCRGHVLVVGGDSTVVLTGWMVSTTSMRGSTLTDLNFTPTTISMTGLFYVYAGGGFADVSSVALQSNNKHNIDVTTSTVLQSYAVAIMRGADSNSKIVISDGLG